MKTTLIVLAVVFVATVSLVGWSCLRINYGRDDYSPTTT